MKSLLATIFMIVLLSSCGPSREQIEAELRRSQEITDSINLASQMEAQRQAELKQQMIALKSQLAGEEAKLSSIQEYQLLRSRDEKAQQVADQTRVIEEIKSQMEEIKSQMQ